MAKQSIARNARLYAFRGEELTLRECAAELGISVAVLRGRIRRGWKLEEISESQGRIGDRLTYNGETMSIEQWFKKLGLDARVLRKKLAGGASVKEMLLLPLMRHSTHPHARRVEISGSSKTIAEWAKEKGVDKRRLRRRLDSGWLPQLAVDVD